MSGLRVGIVHHYGWAVAVTADAEHEVVDRRRIELIEPGLPAAPIHHHGGTHALHDDGAPLDDAALAALVAEVRAAAERASSRSLDALAASLPGPVSSISLRAWPPDQPNDISILRRPPHESRADSVMYRQVLADLAVARGWEVHVFEARDAETAATAILGTRAEDVLRGPGARLGPPWTKDHRTALAATVLAAP